MWLTGWSYRKQITISATNVDATLSNVVVAVPLASTSLVGALSSGADIRFTASDGTTLLSYEWTGWTGSGYSGAFVLVPSIDATNGATIYVYYGKSDATDATDKSSVWADAAVAAHLDSWSSGQYESANGYELVSSGTISSGTGILGGGVDLDGTKDITIGSTGDIFDQLSSSTGFSISTHIQDWDPTTANQKTLFVQGAYASSVFLNLVLRQDAVIDFDVYLDYTNGTRYRTLKASGLTSGDDAHICVVCELNNPGTQATGTVYVNGTSVGSATFSTSETTFAVGTPSAAPKIGSGSYTINGIMDEFRFHTKALSAAEVKFLHANLSNSGNELSFGSPETAGANLSTVLLLRQLQRRRGF